MTDVFISYSRKDIAFARLLHEALGEHGFETWIDWQDIPPSADWLAEVYTAIEGSDTFIFILSEHSAISEICQLEIDHATNHGKRVIPIVISEVDPQRVPPQLQALRGLFFQQQDPLLGPVDDLIEALQHDRAWINQHTRYLMLALDWERRSHNPALLLRGSELQEAESWLRESAAHEVVPTDIHQRFILASRGQAARRQRRMLALVLGVLAVSITLGVSALVLRGQAIRDEQAQATAQGIAETEAAVRSTAEGKALADAALRATAQYEAEGQQSVAEEQRDLGISRLLASESLRQIEDIDLALLLALEALEVSQTREARSSLLAGLTAYPHLAQVVHSGQPSDVAALAATADGDYLAMLNADGELTVWDWPAQQIVQGPLKAPVHDPVGLAAGEEILVWNAAGEMARLNAAGEWTLQPAFALPAAEAQAPCAVSSDARQVLFAGSAAFYLLKEDADLVELAYYDWNPQVAAFSADAAVLAAGYAHPDFDEHVVLLWDTARLEMLGEPIPMKEDTYELTSLAFTADGAALGVGSRYLRESVEASGDEEQRLGKRLYFYDLSQDQPIRFEHGYLFPEVESRMLQFSADGEWLISSDGILVEVARWTGSRALEEHSFSIEPAAECLALVAHNNQLASCGTAGRIFTWSLPKQETLIQQPFNDSNSCYYLAVTQQGSELVTYCSMTGLGLTVWDLETSQRLRSAARRLYEEDEEFLLETLSISPDGALIAAGYKNGAVVLWDTATLEPVGDPLLLHQQSIQALAFSEDGRLLFSGTTTLVEEATTLAIWSVEREALIASFSYDEAGIVNQLLPGGDGLLAVASSTLGQNTHLLLLHYDAHKLLAGDLDALQLEQVTERSENLLGPVSAIQALSQLSKGKAVFGASFAPSGAEVVLVGATTIAHVPLNGEEPALYPLRGLASVPQHAAFAPGLELLALGLSDNTNKGILDTIVLWDMQTQAPLEPALPGYSDRFTNSITDLAFTPDGRYLISYGHGDKLMRWDLSLSSWRKTACHLANRQLTLEEWQAYLGERHYQPQCAGAGSASLEDE